MRVNEFASKLLWKSWKLSYTYLVRFSNNSCRGFAGTAFTIGDN